MRKARVPVAAAGILAAALLCLGAADPPASGDAARWTALDISASMSADIILTPNELYRCWELEQTAGRGIIPPSAFGGHNIGYFWGCVAYVLKGQQYPSWRPKQAVQWGEVSEDGGLPVSGHVGAYRLYMDELEHPQWSVSTPDYPRQGRNAVMLAKTEAKGPGPLRIPLAVSQRRMYSKIRFLFLARVCNPQWHGANRVRLVAEYDDGSTSRLWEGQMGYAFSGRSLGGGPGKKWSLPKGQREALRMTCFAEAAGTTMHINKNKEELACLIEFDKPLSLDSNRTLAAILLDSADRKTVTRWEVYVLAASALPEGK